MEVKRDGWRTLASIETEGVTLRTRAGNEIASVPYVNAALGVLPPDTTVDGEIVDVAATADRSWSRTQTICSTSRPHQPIEQDPPLTLVLFDALIIEGRVLTHQPLTERKQALHELLQAAPVQAAAGGVLAESQWQLSDPAVAAALVKQGHEGVVIKHRASRYFSGANNAGWYKWNRRGLRRVHGRPGAARRAGRRRALPAGERLRGDRVGNERRRATGHDGAPGAVCRPVDPARIPHPQGA